MARTPSPDNTPADKPTPRSSARSGNPAVRAGAVPPSGVMGRGRRTDHPAPATSTRRALERWSAPWLIRLHSVPRWLVPVAMALLLFGGLVVPGVVGGLLLLLLSAFLGWLLAVSWPLLTGTARGIRVLVVGAVLVVGVARIVAAFG